MDPEWDCVGSESDPSMDPVWDFGDTRATAEVDSSFEICVGEGSKGPMNLVGRSLGEATFEAWMEPAS